MNNRKSAQREAYIDVPETCPKVDKALEVASEAIKVQTGNLREALVDAIERALDAEDKVSTLEYEVAELQKRLEEVEHEN